VCTSENLLTDFHDSTSVTDADLRRVISSAFSEGSKSDMTGRRMHTAQSLSRECSTEADDVYVTSWRKISCITSHYFRHRSVQSYFRYTFIVFRLLFFQLFVIESCCYYCMSLCLVEHPYRDGIVLLMTNPIPQSEYFLSGPSL